MFELYYFKDGRKATSEKEKLEILRLMGSLPYKRVGKTLLPDGKLVSTVWLGVDHGNGEKPLVFETMVFTPKGKRVFCGRYSTLEEAEKGHEKVVDFLQPEAYYPNLDPDAVSLDDPAY